MTRRLLLALFASVVPSVAAAQPSSLLPTDYFHAIREEASGEAPLVDFKAIEARFSGWAPSKGGDEMADYIASRMREHGLEQVAVEGFPADGRKYVWAFLTEPAWEAEAGSLTMVEPNTERLADFALHRVVLGRFSSSADVRADLVDVGAGVAEADYQGKDVAGKLVLASGSPGDVHARAVWQHKAAGVVWFRTQDSRERPHLVSNAAIVPWQGPQGEPPGFTFSVSYTTGMDLRRQLTSGRRIVLHALVRASTGPGEYKQVTAAIPGIDPTLREVWIKAHTNYRNTGGGNNLTGVGATIELARVMRRLTSSGVLPKPRRTIRFFWSAEHYGATYQFHRHPDWLDRVLGLLNVDMTGFHQGKTGATMWLYRLPHSLPHFLSDVGEEFLRSVGRANTVVLLERDGVSRADPTYAPTGSREQMRYGVSDFWGPSDHEDVAEGSLRVPAVLYNDWPDPFIGTQEDNLDKADPTQMRRAILTVGATAYYLATVDGHGISSLVNVMVEYAQARLATDARRAFDAIEAASGEALLRQHLEAVNLLKQAIRRESAALETVAALAHGAETDRAVARARRQLTNLNDVNLAALTERSRTRASSLGLTWREPERTPDERRLATLVAARNMAIRGPVNIFRPEYGATWLIEKTKDPQVTERLAIRKAGPYVWYEAMNFVDGKRTLLDIRDLVSAEYGPIAPADLEEFFRLLERVGVVTLLPHSQPTK
jgi:hypothetical protein